MWEDIQWADLSPLDLLQVLKEELQLLGGSLSVALIDQISLGLFYATVIDGRNTAASDVFSVSLAYSFDTYAF